jgi:hypothetical protein
MTLHHVKPLDITKLILVHTMTLHRFFFFFYLVLFFKKKKERKREKVTSAMTFREGKKEMRNN